VKSTRKWEAPRQRESQRGARNAIVEIIWGEGMITDFYGLVNFEVQA
jgi:hypothetical protein